MNNQFLVDRIAEKVEGISFESLPQDIPRKIKICILDALECAFSRPVDARKQSAFRSVPKTKQREKDSVLLFGSDYYSDQSNAAFVNSVYISSSPRIDIDKEKACHAGSVVIPSALAVAESKHLNGKRLIEGIVAGYETMIRLGYAFEGADKPKAFRPTAIYAPYGSAFAAAKTMGFDADGIARAVSFACHTASGFFEWSESGTGEDAFQSGWGARNGVQAALLAGGGVPACHSILEGKTGFLSAFGAIKNADLLIEGLGRIYLTEDILKKPIAACLMVQAPCQLVEKISRTDGFDWHDVKKITITVCRQAKTSPGCDNNSNITLPSHATQSIQYAVAGTVIGKSCSGINWLPPYSKDYLSLMSRCFIEVDDNYTKVFPHRTPARVVVEMTDGKTFELEADDFKSLSDDEVISRFYKTLGWAYSKDELNRIFDGVMALDTMDDISDFTNLLKINNGR